ncbi:DUF1643 domain-containing protein [Priestia megaterium]
MIQEECSTIVSRAIYDSKERQYRYFLSRAWDEKKKIITILMLNPSKANTLVSDKTVNNIIRYFEDSEYGSLQIVNLFAYATSDPDNLKYRKQDKEELNDDYIVSACENADLIIIAWTRGEKKPRKREVAKLLEPFQDKTKCFQDETGKKPRHPRDLKKEEWKLVDYSFSEIENE